MTQINLNWGDSSELTPNEYEAAKAALKSLWPSSNSGFDINNQNLINYYKEREKNNKIVPYLTDNALGATGTLGWVINPIIGVAGSILGGLEDFVTSKNNANYELWKKLTNNGQKTITQEDFERAYRDSQNYQNALLDGLSNVVSDVGMGMLPFNGATRLGKVSKAIASEILGEGLQLIPKGKGISK